MCAHVAKPDSTSRAPLDIARLVSVARHTLTRNPDVQDWPAICTAVGIVHNGKLASVDRVFENTFATDADVDTITQLIPDNVGCPNDCSDTVHECRSFLALFLLQVIAGDLANTAVFLGWDRSVHPLL